MPPCALKQPRDGARCELAITRFFPPQGVGSYVIDYVKEVTLDEGAASAQMKLHELMDEAAALDWVTLSARQSLSSLRNRLHSGGVDLLDVLGLTARVGVLLEVAGTLR